MTLYGFLADALVVVHAIWVGVVVFGLLAVLLGGVLGWRWIRNVWFRAIHLGMISFVAFEAVMGIPCPLTEWEDKLRLAAGESVEKGSFIGRIVHDLIFYDFPPWVFTIIYCVFGAVVLTTMLLVPPQWPGRKRAAA